MYPPKDERNEALVKYRKKNPCSTGADIARVFGISRQRVNVLLGERGARTTSIKRRGPPTCLDCGKTIYRGSVRCRQCYSKSRSVPIVCSECGDLFDRKQSYVLRAVDRGQELFFCGKKHQGQYLGRTFGFGSVGGPDPVGDRLEINRSSILELGD